MSWGDRRFEMCGKRLQFAVDHFTVLEGGAGHPDGVNNARFRPRVTEFRSRTFQEADVVAGVMRNQCCTGHEFKKRREHARE